LPQRLVIGGHQGHVRRVLAYCRDVVIAQVIVHEGQRVLDFFAAVSVPWGGYAASNFS